MLLNCSGDAGSREPIAVGHAGQELRLSVPTADRDQRVLERARSKVPGETACVSSSFDAEDFRSEFLVLEMERFCHLVVGDGLTQKCSACSGLT